MKESRLLIWAFCVFVSPTVVRAETPRVVIVLREGKLAATEVSPRSPGQAGGLWKLALRGATAAEISPPEAWPSNATLEELENVLLPKSVQENSKNKSLLLNLKDGAGGAFSGDSIGELFEVVREPDGEGSTGGEKQDDRPGILKALDRAQVTLVRVRAKSKRRRDVRRRDQILTEIVQAAGKETYVFVINFPHKGAGSVVAAGPTLKRGTVIGRKRTFRFLQSALARPFLIQKKGSRHDLFQ